MYLNINMHEQSISGPHLPENKAGLKHCANCAGCVSANARPHQHVEVSPYLCAWRDQIMTVMRTVKSFSYYALLHGYHNVALRRL